MAMTAKEKDRLEELTELVKILGEEALEPLKDKLRQAKQKVELYERRLKENQATVLGLEKVLGKLDDQEGIFHDSDS